MKGLRFVTSGVERDCLCWCLCVVDGYSVAQPGGIEAPSPAWKAERLDLSCVEQQLCSLREEAHQTTGDTQEHSDLTKQPGECGPTETSSMEEESLHGVLKSTQRMLSNPGARQCSKERLERLNE